MNPFSGQLVKIAWLICLLHFSPDIVGDLLQRKLCCKNDYKISIIFANRNLYVVYSRMISLQGDFVFILAAVKIYLFS